MDRAFRTKAKECCSREKERIVAELSECDRKSGGGYRHRCYRSVARRGGRRAKECMLA